MNWENLFGGSGTADWILLTAFHSLWLSLAAFLIIRVRMLRARQSDRPGALSRLSFCLLYR
jgi:hypothetical protein